MDAETLIKEVYIKEVLWNQAHPDHHNRFILEKQWKEIALSMNITKDAVKNKWKYLRDTFRKELAKCKKSRSGDEGRISTNSKWAYFKLLMFLKDQFTPRSSTSNLTVPSRAVEILSVEHQTQEENIEKIELDSITEQQILSPEADSNSLNVDYSSTSASTINEVSQEPRIVIRRRKRMRTPSVGEALLNMERGKLTLLQNKAQKTALPLDEDRCFFESILSHVQKIEPLKKLQFRNKLHELVMHYAYNYSSSNSSNDATTLT